MHAHMHMHPFLIYSYAIKFSTLSTAVGTDIKGSNSSK